MTRNVTARVRRYAADMLDGLSKCERATMLVLDMASRDGLPVDVERIAHVTGYTVAEVEAAVEVLVGRGFANREDRS